MTVRYNFRPSLFWLTAGRGQWPAACRIGHSSKTEKDSHGDGQVNEPAGEFESRAPGEESCCRWREGAAAEGAPPSSEHPGLWEEELQPGLRGDHGAARWPTDKCKCNTWVSGVFNYPQCATKLPIITHHLLLIILHNVHIMESIFHSPIHQRQQEPNKSLSVGQLLFNGKLPFRT